MAYYASILVEVPKGDLYYKVSYTTWRQQLRSYGLVFQHSSVNLGSLKKLPMKKFGITLREPKTDLYEQKNTLQID